MRDIIADNIRRRSPIHGLLMMPAGAHALFRHAMRRGHDAGRGRPLLPHFRHAAGARSAGLPTISTLRRDARTRDILHARHFRFYRSRRCRINSSSQSRIITPIADVSACHIATARVIIIFSAISAKYQHAFSAGMRESMQAGGCACFCATSSARHGQPRLPLQMMNTADVTLISASKTAFSRGQ